MIHVNSFLKPALTALPCYFNPVIIQLIFIRNKLPLHPNLSSLFSQLNSSIVNISKLFCSLRFNTDISPDTRRNYPRHNIPPITVSRFADSQTVKIHRLGILANTMLIFPSFKDRTFNMHNDLIAAHF